MSLPSLNHSNDLRTVVWYLIKSTRYDVEKPYYSNVPFEHPDAKQSNLESYPEEVTIHDMRGRENEFDFDIEGFKVVRKSLQAEYSFFENTDWIQDVYYPQIEQLMKESLGDAEIERIYIYDHTIRRRNPAAPEEWRGEEGALQPVPAAHVGEKSRKFQLSDHELTKILQDHSHGSGPTRVKAHLSNEDAEHLLQKRYQIINVWHPLFGPVDDWPLALCDARSVEKCDLVPTDLIYPHYYGEIYSITCNDRHRWWYLSDQMPEEFLLFKCFDSKQECSRFTPHCGFKNPRTVSGSRPRESIEFRTMVFYKQ